MLPGEDVTGPAGLHFVAGLLVGVLRVVRNFLFISFNERENGGTRCSRV